MAVALAERLRVEKAARIVAQNKAITALQRYRENYNTMPVGLFAINGEGQLVEYNPAFAEMFGLPTVIHGKPPGWADIAGRSSLTALLALQRGAPLTENELAVEADDGSRRWFDLRAVHKNDRIEGWIEEITARKEAEGRLKFLADHDSLTGLMNRRGLNDHLERAIAVSRDRPMCLAYVDLDRFKLVNDLFGHAAGDQILRQLATRVRQVIQPPHLAARVGGDEFVVIISGYDLEGAKAICEDLRREIGDRPYHYQDKAFSVAGSVGVVRLTPDMDVRDSLTASDRACSEAKRAGGSVVVAADVTHSSVSSYLEELKLVQGLRERFPADRFFTQLQPIVSLQHPYSSLCYEVLVRMRDLDGKTVPPGRFIGAAERNGAITLIDRWVLHSTLEWLDANPSHRDSIGFCTMNLSGASLNDERFMDDAIAMIRDHPEAARKICFEITESVALYDINSTRRFVDRVKSFGSRVALDDFGAGYTSFSYLKELPGDLVKIDGSFIRDVNLNSANYAITRAIVDLVHELGMGCVAEWAENADIVRSLIELKVDFAQGYGLSRPLDRDAGLGASHSAALVSDASTIALLSGHASSSARRESERDLRPVLSV